MSPATRLRLWKFSLVGAIGIVVQLGVLAVLLALRTNYLTATALAVEAAVVHNFFWHQRFTWSDRAGSSAAVRLFRFHLSNGLISVAGNLLLMRMLVGWLGVPVLAANAMAISACFVANFLASDRWVFIGSTWAGGLIRSVSVPAPASIPVSAAQREHR